MTERSIKELQLLLSVNVSRFQPQIDRIMMQLSFLKNLVNQINIGLSKWGNTVKNIKFPVMGKGSSLSVGLSGAGEKEFLNLMAIAPQKMDNYAKSVKKVRDEKV